MMTTTKLYAPTRALPAIAAALALLSTSALAQEAQPTTTAPATTVQPAPDTSPPATDATTTAAPATDTSTATTTTKRSVKRTVRTSAAKPAPVAARTVTRTVTKRAAVPAATAAANPPATAPAATAAAAPPAAQTAAAPVVRLDAKPAPAKTSAAASKPIDNDTLKMAGGGLLALLALVGIASVLIGRRRSRREKELADAQVLAYEPFETAAAPEHTPAVNHEEPAAAASAFAWGNQEQAYGSAASNERTAEGDDRRPGESWVERAYRGPSSNNPSVSLRTRLKRAAFFDKREREAAAGTAAPVDGSAGLPDAMVDEQEREMA